MTATYSASSNSFNASHFGSTSKDKVQKRTSFQEDFQSTVTIRVEQYESFNGVNTVQTTHSKHENLDPKLLQVAQLFVQDLIARAKIEVHKKLAASERQALLHEDPLFHDGDDPTLIDRIRREVTQRCRRVYNLFLSCLGHLP